MFEWEWWDGTTEGRGVPFVQIKGDSGLVKLSAGMNEYDVWGLVELDPDTADTIAYQLIEAAEIARGND